MLNTFPKQTVDLFLVVEEESFCKFKGIITNFSVLPDNIKALFRRGKAHMGAWNPEEAEADFERVVDLDPSLAGCVRKLLQEISDLRKQKDAEDRSKLCGKLFSSDPPS